MLVRFLRIVLWLTATLLLSALIYINPPRWQEWRHYSAENFRLETQTLASGLNHPWSMAFLPDGSLLVNERTGQLRRISPEGQVSAPISGTPEVVTGGQAGLFDVALDPDFPSNRWIYLSFAENGPQDLNGLAVMRGRLSADLSHLQHTEVIFRQRPKSPSQAHFGGRLAFSPDKRLFITVGERYAERELAQSLQSHHGKIIRINRDGSIPADNPFRHDSTALPEIWSLGHRNPQGAALHPETGELWISEHGPQGGDEINRILSGRNYGWPLISYGCEYGSCTPIGNGTAQAGLEQPVIWWGPKSTAPSGLAFYQGDRYPDWRGDLFSGSLAGHTLWRLHMEGNRITRRQALLTGMGKRIRDVREGPDGWLYLLTDEEDGALLRLLRR